MVPRNKKPYLHRKQERQGRSKKQKQNKMAKQNPNENPKNQDFLKIFRNDYIPICDTAHQRQEKE